MRSSVAPKDILESVAAMLETVDKMADPRPRIATCWPGTSTTRFPKPSITPAWVTIASANSSV